jgi:hypothetical protein
MGPVCEEVFEVGGVDCGGTSATTKCLDNSNLARGYFQKLHRHLRPNALLFMREEQNASRQSCCHSRSAHFFQIRSPCVREYETPK